jgi:hypothetical protein
MNIHQVSVTYLPEQDRFLARISSREGEELRLWLTRRLLLPLMPVLTKTATEQLARQTAKIDPAAPPDAQRQRIVENFKKEALAHAATSKPPTRPKTPHSLWEKSRCWSRRSRCLCSHPASCSWT